MALVIPAHNEESTIEPTIHALQESIAALPLVVRRTWSFDLVVAANGCTDQTIWIAKKCGVIALEFPAWGKWKTLEMATTQVTADWIVFVDSGTVWGPQALTYVADFVSRGSRHDVGFTFEYDVPQGLVSRAYWRVEALFKKIEQRLGGVVAVSGFTMGFDRHVLLEVFASLSVRHPGFNWLNDDVVIPLTLRLLNPEYRIHLLSAPGLVVLDQGLGKPVREEGRRLRMMRGNVQWIRQIWFTEVLRLQDLRRWGVALLATRRVLKVFWIWIWFAIWGLCVPLVGAEMALVLSGLPFFSNRIRPASKASFVALIEIFRKRNSTSWN